MKERAKTLAGLDLDKLIHERSRLMVLTYLSSSEKGEAGFTELRDALEFSAGNLSVQIKTLEEAGYVRVDKRFVSNKSFTGVSLTDAGHSALTAYLNELEVVITSLKASQRGAASRVDASKGDSDDDPASGRRN